MVQSLYTNTRFIVPLWWDGTNVQCNVSAREIIASSKEQKPILLLHNLKHNVEQTVAISNVSYVSVQPGNESVYGFNMVESGDYISVMIVDYNGETTVAVNEGNIGDSVASEVREYLSDVYFPVGAEYTTNVYENPQEWLEGTWELYNKERIGHIYTANDISNILTFHEDITITYVQAVVSNYSANFDFTFNITGTWSDANKVLAQINMTELTGFEAPSSNTAWLTPEITFMSELNGNKICPVSLNGGSGAITYMGGGSNPPASGEQYVMSLYTKLNSLQYNNNVCDIFRWKRVD